MKGRELNKTTVKRLAIHAGFKLKNQNDGSVDLNDYVYDFASLIQMARFGIGKVDIEPPQPSEMKWDDFCAGCTCSESLPIGCIVNPVEFGAVSDRPEPPEPPEPPKARVVKKGESLPLQILMCFLLGAIFGALFAIALLSCLPV